MRILAFGIYDPAYSRNWVLLRGLRSAGATVTECSDRSGGLMKFFKLALKHWRLRNSYDAMLVMFPGQEVMLLARLLARRPIIFDAFTSHYEGHVLDRKTVSPHSWKARWYHWLDRAACRAARVVLTDTTAHADWFAREFHLSRNLFHAVPVGTNTDIFHAAPEPTGAFTVAWYGHYIPLQGVPTIIEAAVLLKDQGIQFNLIGVGQTYRACRTLAERLGVDNINFVGNVPYSDLAGWIAKAHVCLGIFGDSIKTQAVIPNKVFDALAMARAIITADTPAIRELCDEHAMLLIPAANPQALADAIVRLRDDASLRAALARRGHEIFLEKATTELIGQAVATLIKTIL